MRRRRRTRHTDLALTIVTSIFFIAVVALFMLMPMIDNMIGEAPYGLAAYDPLQLFVQGAMDLISFNFASRKYMLLFGFGCVVAALLILWLIGIIVKKQPKKLVFWFIFLIMAGATGVMASGYLISTCRTVTLVGGRELNQVILTDLFNGYASERLKDFPNEAPFVFYNFISQIIGIGVIGVMALVGLFAVLTPFICGLQILLRKPYVEVKEEPKEVSKEPSEEELKKAAMDEAKARREAQYVAYVEYRAGKPLREKEYEELCKANGIPLPEEYSDDDYYAETAAQLGCLHEQPVEEVSDDDYYKQLAAQLGCLHEQPVEEPVEEKESEEEYNERVAKELALFRLIKASQNAKIEKYYRDVIDELSMFSKDEDHKNDAAISNLKRRAAEKRAYYERLEKELPCLQYQKPPVEPDVSDDE